MIEVELVGQMSCWCLNLELFNTNAMFGKMLNFEQRRDMVKLASKTIAQVPWRVEGEFKRNSSTLAWKIPWTEEPGRL